MKVLIITSLTVFLYLGTTLLLSRRLASGMVASQGARLGLIALGLGAVILHGGLVYNTIFTEAGLNLGFYSAASLIMSLVALLMLLAAITQPIENLGIVVLPLAAISLLLDQFLSSQHILASNTTQNIEIHIILSLLAYSLLSIAAVQAVLLAVQDYQLRHKHPGGFMRALPPMRVMESLLFQIIGVGFFLLSLALLSGIIYLEDIFAQHLVHKTVLSIIAWLVFAILLFGRRLAGWRGRTAIRWTLAGFVTLLLAYFGSKLVLEIILA
ncbi:cytochrome C assembly family protein [Sulfuriflexus mobilis]|uniref:cytochrome C assembly family protein n=1 Tax=Sulfuriflexus mobilis TaxID=1811807 RepID=UPI000F829EEF|nr:cytochrome c biogenesis protein CcsA [Sulfuriflexus mobilis]